MDPQFIEMANFGLSHPPQPGNSTAAPSSWKMEVQTYKDFDRGHIIITTRNRTSNNT